MVKNLSKVLKILTSEQTALAATLQLEQTFVFCILINKNVLEWFLQIICKEHLDLQILNIEQLHAVFNKQHFYKQRQAEIGKNKQKLSITLRLNFRYQKIICFLHPCYHPKMLGDIVKNYKKTSASVLMTFIINDNENEAGNEKQITRIQHKQTQA